MAGIFELNLTTANKYHFTLKAGNGEVILDSEHYEARAGAENGIESVRKNAQEDKRFERRTSKADQPYFVLKAPNGEIIGRSQMYSSNPAMENGIASVKSHAPGATLRDVTAADKSDDTKK